ncbi:uncharacterized protein [Watersipora subatra]|uniref:uncharacterized protein isoform X2 n=1 Tax=Watersipora subatra TaxID=2589382 RepID=UPI00355C3C2A
MDQSSLILLICQIMCSSLKLLLFGVCKSFKNHVVQFSQRRVIKIGDDEVTIKYGSKNMVRAYQYHTSQDGHAGGQRCHMTRRGWATTLQSTVDIDSVRVASAHKGGIKDDDHLIPVLTGRGLKRKADWLDGEQDEPSNKIAKIIIRKKRRNLPYYY